MVDIDMAEVNKLRRQQTARVMPLIGPLLDAWEGTVNDLKSDIEDMEPSLYRALEALARAVESD